MTIVTLEQELQELVERMLDDTDLAAYADVVSRAIEAIKALRQIQEAGLDEPLAGRCGRAGFDMAKRART